jgi:hypothetical protein
MLHNSYLRLNLLRQSLNILISSTFILHNTMHDFNNLQTYHIYTYKLHLKDTENVLRHSVMLWHCERYAC